MRSCRRSLPFWKKKVREATGELVRQNEVLRRQHMELTAGVHGQIAIPGECFP